MRTIHYQPPQDPKAPMGAGQLMNQVGAFCAMCEIPLPDMVWLWDSQTNKVVSEPTTADRAQNLLMLCHNCHQAFNRDATEENLKGLLLPHRDTIHVFGDTLQFEYVLEEHTYEIHNDNETVETRTENYAIVKAHTPEAQKTIDHFALNTPFHDPINKRFKVSQYDHNTLADRRVELRTRTWTTVRHMVHALEAHEGTSMIETVHQQIHHISAAAGHWSVWVTLFWNLFKDVQLLEKLFWPPVNKKYYHGFPGTSRHYFE